MSLLDAIGLQTLTSQSDMYIRKVYEVTELAKQAELIKKYPLGIVFSANPSPGGGLLGFMRAGSLEEVDSELCATHVPFFFVEGKDGESHKLVAHLAANNQQGKQLEKVGKVLVVFQSVDSYTSPAWYPLKKKTHKYVPTWNFAAVHVYGTPKVIRNDKEWLLRQLNQITDQEEGKRPEGEGYEEKWKVSDAPEKYIDAKLKNIVGLEIEITAIQSKFKFGQDEVPTNVNGVLEGLEKEVGGEKGEEMCKLTRECYPGEL